MNEIKALCFDVFGTVVDWRTSIITEGEAINKEKGEKIDWAAFADRWRGMYQPAMQAVRIGLRPWTTLDVLHRESLDILIKEFNLEHWSKNEIANLNNVWHRLQPWPDSVEGLYRLKKKFIISPVSNGNVRLIVDMAKHADLPWDMVLGAEVAQCFKPLPDAYIKSIALLDLQPEQCCMVAAHNSDLVAAASHGMKTAFVGRTSEYGPHQSEDFEAEHSYHYIAENFLDLAKQLRC